MPAVLSTAFRHSGIHNISTVPGNNVPAAASVPVLPTLPPLHLVDARLMTYPHNVSSLLLNPLGAQVSGFPELLALTLHLGTWSVCSVTVCAQLRVCRSHSFTLASLEPVANAPPPGWQATLSTHDSCPAHARA